MTACHRAGISAENKVDSKFSFHIRNTKRSYGTIERTMTKSDHAEIAGIVNITDGSHIYLSKWSTN
jgi:hypothetical protein